MVQQDYINIEKYKNAIYITNCQQTSHCLPNRWSQMYLRKMIMSNTDDIHFSQQIQFNFSEMWEYLVIFMWQKTILYRKLSQNIYWTEQTSFLI